MTKQDEIVTEALKAARPYVERVARGEGTMPEIVCAEATLNAVDEALAMRAERVDDDADSGDAVARAEMIWAQLPRVAPWTSLLTHEKALVCHQFDRLQPKAPEPTFTEIAQAMIEGVHE